MPHVLIACSTVDGHTLKICERMRHLLQERGLAVTLVTVDQALAMDCAAFDRIVIGASIRYGRHRPAVFEFVRRQRDLLQRVPSAFFSVNVVARKPGKNTPEGNPYFQTFVRQSGWAPRLGGVFAGRIDYPRCRPLDRMMIRFIMWVTHGPTDPKGCFEFTDWPAMDAFADQLAQL